MRFNRGHIVIGLFHMGPYQGSAEPDKPKATTQCALAMTSEAL